MFRTERQSCNWLYRRLRPTVLVLSVLLLRDVVWIQRTNADARYPLRSVSSYLAVSGFNRQTARAARCAWGNADVPNLDPAIDSFDVEYVFVTERRGIRNDVSRNVERFQFCSSIGSPHRKEESTKETEQEEVDNEARSSFCISHTVQPFRCVMLTLPARAFLEHA